MTQLRRLREAKGMRQERLAADAEVSISTIRAHESGRAQGVETRPLKRSRACWTFLYTNFFLTRLRLKT
ncbi:helix-turn-helix domain-containing protein [Deinococcus pimensis]|uniref:helix-turn-helix domain-containing protein n=1 Tax=Deinococcus pimensis TaxID=309888 RepID=UPI00146FBE1C|nr:helix-turn-helix transcriptional regulator [Deinococcus pimensis]